MARIRKYQGRNSNPIKAGSQNISEEMIKVNQDESAAELMASLTELFKIASSRRKKPASFTPAELETHILSFFEFCAEKSIKPTKGLLRTYLCISQDTYNRWTNNPEKFGGLSTLMDIANEIIAGQYATRGEKYPTMNTFLLKASHGYYEKNHVEVTGNVLTVDNIADKIAKLGLSDGGGSKED